MIEVKKGDRIRATRGEIISVKGVVTHVDYRSASGPYVVLSDEVDISLTGGRWEIEVLPKPLPTEPGYYVREDADLTDEEVPIYNLTQNGEWFYLRYDPLEWDIVKEEPSDLVPLVKGER